MELSRRAIQIGALFCLLNCSIVGYSQEATLEETLSWIKGRIESLAPVPLDAEVRKSVIGYYHFNYQGCEVEYTFEHHFDVKDGQMSDRFLTTAQKVDLKNIQDVDYYQGQGTLFRKDFASIRLNTLWKQKLVKTWHPIDKAFLSPEDEKDAGMRYWFDIDHPEADRLKKAFDHAIRLCGGGPKEEKF